MKTRPNRQIAIYGKGGIGKSTTSSSLATLLAIEGKRVLLVGCDPKKDTTFKILPVRPVPTVLGMLQARGPHDLTLDDFVKVGRHGITCVEAGGPEPGMGCAGRGLSKMFELFESMHLFEKQFDIALYDVLGDVVCGGFSVPIRKGYATEVMVVVSGELMALYAANNICRSLVRLQNNGVRLLGLIGNLRALDGEREVLEAFAERLGTRLLPTIRRSTDIAAAEQQHATVFDSAPDSPVAQDYRQLCATITALGPEDAVVPTPLGEVEFERFVRDELYRIEELD